MERGKGKGRGRGCERDKERRRRETDTREETEMGERWRVTRGTGSSDPPTLLDSREMGMDVPQA